MKSFNIVAPFRVKSRACSVVSLLIPACRLSSWYSLQPGSRCLALWTLSEHRHYMESYDGRRIGKDLKYPYLSRSWWIVEAVVWSVMVMRSPVPLSLGYVAVSMSFGRGCPYLLPLSKAHFLNLSLDVGKKCEGIRAAAWKVCRTFRTLVCSLISNNLCVSWHPLNVDLNVWSCLEEVVEVVDYLDGEVLSCCYN